MKKFIWLVLIVLFFARLWTGSSRPPELPAESVELFITRAIDGDTLLSAEGHRIRLLGVDTPETKHPDRPPEPLGKEASDFTARLVNGKRVRVVFDRERYDNYQRLLAYVYIGDLLLNELLIENGLSEAETQFPFRSDMKRRFEQAEERARQARVGIWMLPQNSSTP